MTYRLHLAIALAATAGATTACVEEAHIAAPSHFAAATERLELTGMGGGTGGTFQLAGAMGRFSRGAERASGSGLVDKRGGGSFSFAGPVVQGRLSGFCRFSESEAKLGRGISVTTDPLAYSCVFERDGRPIDAELVLEAAHDSSGALFRYERRGVLRFEGQEIGLRSIHKAAGGKLPTATPLGYTFTAREEEIGAVDLNGSEKTIFAPREPRLREAVIAAGLALSVFWDPGDSN